MDLQGALNGSDVFIGLSVGGVLDENMVKSMTENAIIFALANPDPEVLPDFVYKCRSDVIVATGRSDFYNQVNNVLCFPYLFAFLLKYRKGDKIHKIDNDLKMKLAGFIAEFAQGDKDFGKNKIVPNVFDSGLYEYLEEKFKIFFDSL